jgi:uncharacterized OsmC-like protein
MTSLQASPHPIAFPIADPLREDLVAQGSRAPRGRADGALGRESNEIRIRTHARALEGMQKEALVATAGASAWRMACDEGPYLNGTDLAPFPLAFFTAGLVNSYLAEILALAKARGIAAGGLEIIQDSLYAMEGSAVRGDMIGSALPVELHVRVDAHVPQRAIEDLVMSAVVRSPADALLRSALASEFSLANNGEPLAVGRVQPWIDAPTRELAAATFDSAEPDQTAGSPRDIITKLDSAQVVFGVEGGAGSSLRAEQERSLHVRGIVTMREDGLSETHVQLFKPIGSNFRFLCAVDETLGGKMIAPKPLDYLSAGIAFCYLTQIGRYASIMKYELGRYALTQDTAFGLASDRGPSSAEPVRTRVALAGAVDDDTARRVVDMGERTCFLHAASRMALKSKVRIAREQR